MKGPSIPWEWEYAVLWQQTCEALWRSKVRLNRRFMSLCCSPTNFEQFPAGLDLRVTAMDEDGGLGKRSVFEVLGCGMEFDNLGTLTWDVAETGWPARRVRLELGRADVGWGGRRNYVASATVPTIARPLVYSVAKDLARVDEAPLASVLADALTRTITG